MTPLQSLIDQHYIGQEKDELHALLDEFGFVQPIEYLLSHKNILENKDTVHDTASQILVAINNQMAKLKNEPEKKRKAERILGTFAMNVFREVLKKIPPQYHLEVIGKVKVQLKSTCNLWNWDYIALNEVFQIEILEGSQNKDLDISLDFNEIPKTTEKLKLIWTQKGSLDKLSEILFEDECISNKQDFINFIIGTDNTLKLIWAETKKYHLAYLMNQLIGKDFLRISPSKGFYVYTECHIIYDSNKIPAKNSLKKIMNKMNEDHNKYITIIQKIDNMLNSILQN